jgi:hypothetical protein
MKKQYKENKAKKVGEYCICPSCRTGFTKTQHQQAFCKSKEGTICKDKYWNTVIPTKRCNRTRISPASAAWMGSQREARQNAFDPHDDDHPFSSEALGQWCD